jgi:hypothetical protein
LIVGTQYVALMLKVPETFAVEGALDEEAREPRNL